MGEFQSLEVRRCRSTLTVGNVNSATFGKVYALVGTVDTALSLA